MIALVAMNRAAGETFNAGKWARRFPWRRAPALLIAAIVVGPLLVVLASLFSAGDAGGLARAGTWSRYVGETLALCLLVGAGATIIGAGAAVLVSVFEFPGRRLLAPLLIMPFAVPAYISAYAYADLFSPFGFFHAIFGAGAALPEIRSLPGAALVLSLTVYPYVYLAARASIEARSGAFLEAAQTLGASRTRAIRLVLLPGARAAIAGGAALALMETSGEYGVADYFGLSTLSVGIFRTWHGLGDLVSASQLASGLFVLALLLVIAEEASRRGSLAESARATRAPVRLRATPAAGALMAVFCAAPVVLGFVTPVSVLAFKAATATSIRADGLAAAFLSTASVAAAAAALAAALAVALAYAQRSARSPAEHFAIRTATLGYAVPGAVLAIGALGVADAFRSAMGLLVPALALLLYAYVVRFLTAAYNVTAAGYAQIHPLTDDAARMLGARPFAVVRRAHWPLARRSIAAGALIVCIDIARELPATLLLRPFNFETLATRAYRLASDERLAEAAPAALLLIGISLAPLVLLGRLSGAARERRSPSE